MINRYLLYKAISVSLFTALLCYGTYLRVNSPIGVMGDTGLLYGLLQSVHEGNGPYLPLFASISDILFNFNLASLSPELVCEKAQLSLNYSLEQQNFFQYHSYLILYPLSLLLYFFSSPYVIQGVNLFSFLSFIYLSFYILRKNNIKVGPSLVACTLICFSLPWSFGIVGQPYIDRIFLPLGLLLFYFYDKRDILAILCVIFIACLINEKIPIYIGIFLIVSSIIFFNKNWYKFYVTQFILGIFIITVVFIYIKFYLNNTYYSVSIPYSFSAIKNYLLTERNIDGIIALLLICSPFLIITLFYKWKHAIIALIMLVPNILGDIGGAEKTNFYTHYHTLYFPFLVYAFLVGFSSFIKNIYDFKSRIYITYISIFLIVFIYNGINILPNQKLSFDLNNNNSFIFSFNKIKRTQISWNKIQKILDEKIPFSSSISTIEAGMGYLYKYRNLSIYPLNLNHSDYILVIKGNGIFNGYFGYNGIEAQEKTNMCLNYIIRKKYDTENIIYLTPDYVLLKNKF